MTEERAKRKLRAILSADVKGYSNRPKDGKYLKMRSNATDVSVGAGLRPMAEIAG